VNAQIKNARVVLFESATLWNKKEKRLKRFPVIDLGTGSFFIRYYFVIEMGNNQ
jgi:hypothetical protein